MDDKELLTLAAKAAGFDYITETEGDVFAWKERSCIEWNPLTDDGDALRLAVTLLIHVGYAWDDLTQAYDAVIAQHGGIIFEEPLCNDPYAATRRAIVRAAASIGEQMK